MSSMTRQLLRHGASAGNPVAKLSWLAALGANGAILGLMLSVLFAACQGAPSLGSEPPSAQAVQLFAALAAPMQSPAFAPAAGRMEARSLAHYAQTLAGTIDDAAFVFNRQSFQGTKTSFAALTGSVRFSSASVNLGHLIRAGGFRPGTITVDDVEAYVKVATVALRAFAARQAATTRFPSGELARALNVSLTMSVVAGLPSLRQAGLNLDTPGYVSDLNAVPGGDNPNYAVTAAVLCAQLNHLSKEFLDAGCAALQPAPKTANTEAPNTCSTLNPFSKEYARSGCASNKAPNPLLHPSPAPASGSAAQNPSSQPSPSATQHVGAGCDASGCWGP